MADLININTANAKRLTQLPGIAKNVAYRIVNHRKRHGYFTHWEELLEVKRFSGKHARQHQKACGAASGSRSATGRVRSTPN